MKRSCFIDGLKFILCMIIFFGHYSYFISQEYADVIITDSFVHLCNKISPLCVSLFFMISGYFCCKNLEKYDSVDYLKKQVKKLSPMYIASIVLFVIVSFIYCIKAKHFYAGRTVELSNLLFTLTGIQSWIGHNFNINGPCWYVSSLFFCLCVVCMLYKYFNKNLVTVLIFLISLSLMQMNCDFYPLSYKNILALVNFSFGILLNYLSPAKKKIYMLVSCLCCFICIVSFFKGISIMGDRQLFITFFAGPFCIFFSELDIFSRFKKMSVLAELSYSIYLFQIPVFILIGILFETRINYDSRIVSILVFSEVLLLSFFAGLINKKCLSKK